jgi:hypothetical protein
MILLVLLPHFLFLLPPPLLLQDRYLLFNLNAYYMFDP